MKKILYICYFFISTLSASDIQSKTVFPPDINSVNVPDSTAAFNYMQIADSLYEFFDLHGAIYNYRLAIEEYEKFDDWENVVYCTTQIGKSFLKKADYHNAQISFQKSIEIADKKLEENHPLLIQRLHGLIGMNLELGNYEIAVKQAYEAIDLCNINDNSTGYPIDKYLAKTYYLFSQVDFENGRYDEALEKVQKALIIYKSGYGENDFFIAQCLNFLAVVYTETGKFDSALQNYEKAISIFKNSQGSIKSNLALSYQNMAIILGEYKGDYIEAKKYYDKSLRIILEAYGEHHTFAALIYYNIGLLYEKMSDYEKALLNYNKSLRIYESLFGVEHTDIAMCHRSIGDVYKELGEFKRSYDYYSIALSIQLRIFGIGHPEVARAYNSIGELKRFQNQFDNGMKFHKEALEIFETNYGESHPEISKTFNLMGLNNASRNNYEEALRNFQKAIISNTSQYSNFNLNSNPKINDVISEPLLLESLNNKIEVFLKLYEKTSNLNYLISAFDSYRISIELIETMKISYRAEESKQFLAQNSSEFYENAISISLKLFIETNDQFYKNQAYVFSQKSKAGILLDAMNKSRAEKFADIPDSLIKKEINLKNDLTYYENQIHYLNYSIEHSDSSKMVGLKDKLFSLNRRYTSLINQFEKDYPRYHRAKYRTDEVDTRSVMESLSEDKSLVEYFVGQNNIYAFYFDKHRYEIFTIDHLSSFNELLQSYYVSVKKIDREQYPGSAYGLYKLLIEPMESYLNGKKKLIIIPDGELHYLPFESLISNKNLAPKANYTDLDYLINRFTVSYIYSSSFLIDNAAAEKPTISTEGLIGFAPVFKNTPDAAYLIKKDLPIQGNPDSDDNDSRFLSENNKIKDLPYSEEELKYIIDLFGEKKIPASGYFYYEASKENFMSEVGKYQFVHLATHSFVNPEKPQFSGIIFSQPIDSANSFSTLYSNEIYNLKLNADLVVLSSCESGAGKLIKGEGIMALTRGFLYAGSNNILTSLWKVLDKSTSELMKSFYDSVLSGKSYAESLREAKLNLIKNPETAFPINWCGFVLIGQ